MRSLVPYPTRDRVLELLDYDAGTGVFTWRKTLRGRVVAGRRAGTFDANGYRSICIDGKIVKEHRIAWLITHGSWPSLDIDHANGDPGDNRIENLRVATVAQNIANSRLSRSSKSGLKGVTYDRERWVARIRVCGKSHYLGSFDQKEKAHAAYLIAARKHYGEYARTE